MKVSSEAGVIGQIPAIVIRILIDDDVVAIPVPAITESEIGGSNAPVPAVEPESTGTSASEMPPVRRTKSTSEATMLKGAIDTVVSVVAAGIMSDPTIAGI